MALAPATVYGLGRLPADDRGTILNDVSTLVWTSLQERYAHDPVLGSDRVELQYRWFFYFFLNFPVDNSTNPLHPDGFSPWFKGGKSPVDVIHPDPVAVQIANDGVAGLSHFNRNLCRCLAFKAQPLGNLALLLSPSQLCFSAAHIFSPNICSTSLSRSSLLVSGKTSVVMTSRARLKNFWKAS